MKSSFQHSGSVGLVFKGTDQCGFEFLLFIAFLNFKGNNFFQQRMSHSCNFLIDGFTFNVKNPDDFLYRNLVGLKIFILVVYHSHQKGENPHFHQTE